VKTYYITPNTKPRMTRADKWEKRPCVVKYRAFADKVRELKMNVRENGDKITFILPMAKSWTKKKAEAHLGKPHKGVPDVDNLLKALLDAIFGDDSHIWDVHISKRWGVVGMIIIEDIK